MGRFASEYEYTMYAQINRALEAVRAGDWGLADKIARGLAPGMREGKPYQPDVSAIARLLREIKATGR